VEPKISIITITYNAAQSLRRTLDSVVCQTYPHIEHLIIDGASTDATLAIAEEYKSRSPHQVVITSEPDHGIYDAMNKGLQRATGHYLVFLNAGDSLHAADTIEIVAAAAMSKFQPSNQKLQTSNFKLQTSDLPAVIYGDTTITDDEGHFLRMRRLRPPRQLSWRSFRQGMLVCHQAFYARTDLARQTPYDLHFRHSSDVDWCIRLMKEAERRHLALLNTHAVLADFAEGGDTTQHHRDSLFERFSVMRRHYGLLTTLAMHAWFVVRAVVKK